MPATDLKSKMRITYRKINKTGVFQIIKILLILTAIGGTGYIVINFNVFILKEIEVKSFEHENLEYVSSDSMEQLLVDYIGTKLFLVNIKDVEKKVAESSSFIKEVYVSKHFPDTLIIRIVERDPILTLIPAEDNQNGVLLDVDGIILSNCKNNIDICNSHPAVTVKLDKDQLIAGSKPYAPFLNEVLEVQTFLQSNNIDVKSYFVPEGSVLVCVLKNDTHIVFSLEKSVEQQLREYLQTRDEAIHQQQNYLEIDVRYENPVIRVDKYTEWVTE